VRNERSTPGKSWPGWLLECRIQNPAGLIVALVSGQEQPATQPCTQIREHSPAQRDGSAITCDGIHILRELWRGLKKAAKAWRCGIETAPVVASAD
jgi:hypothetical protein